MCLYRIADCPECQRHAAYLVGDSGRPIPEEFPLPEFGHPGPCPQCKSEDTVPIIRGYPSNKAMLAAARGKVELGGCIIVSDPEGNGPPSRSCRACGTEW